MIRNQPNTCSYCGVKANTRDHVPSKNLLEKPFPINLLTIPSCDKCNNSYSLDEEYFLNVLVEVSENPTLMSKKRIGGSVFKARERSKGLKERIEDSLIQSEDGMLYFQSESDRIKRVIEKNAFGLFYHRYKIFPNLRDFKCSGFYPFSVKETRPSDALLLAFTDKFKPKRWTVMQKNVFSYIVVRDWRREKGLTMILYLHNTTWCIIEIPYPHRRAKLLKYSSGQLPLFAR